jgi:hypothetical protein
MRVKTHTFVMKSTNLRVGATHSAQEHSQEFSKGVPASRKTCRPCGSFFSPVIPSSHFFSKGCARATGEPPPPGYAPDSGHPVDKSLSRAHALAGAVFQCRTSVSIPTLHIFYNIEIKYPSLIR